MPTKRGQVVVRGGKPLDFVGEEDVITPPATTSKSGNAIGAALKAYRTAAGELLNEKYAELAAFAPSHLRERGNIFVAICSDGIFVRYDIPGEEPPKVRTAKVDDTLANIALQFSEQVVYLDVDPFYPEKAPKIQLATASPNQPMQPVLTFAVAMFAQSKPSTAIQVSKPPARPIPILSVQSEVDMELAGELLPNTNEILGGRNQQFLAHNRFQLPVGWRAIEIYPHLGDEHWQADSATMWAELDILAAAAQRNLQQSRYNALDNRLGVREKYDRLLGEFQELLEGPEEPVHQFLKHHPELISPTCERFWSKLAFGSHVSDFVFRESNNDYELVELEAPIRQIFRKDGQQREDLTHAFNQIADWISFIEDNRTQVEQELGLSGISTNPRSLIVIGRSASLRPEDRRKLVTLQNQIPKLRIMTYDDLLASARSTLERILGPLGFTGQNARIYFFTS